MMKLGCPERRMEEWRGRRGAMAEVMEKAQNERAAMKGRNLLIPQLKLIWH